MVGIIASEVLETRIYLIRSQKVMLDHELAVMYGVSTFNLNKAVIASAKQTVIPAKAGIQAFTREF